MKLSIVTSLFNSSAYIEEFCQRIAASAQQITPDFEIILVNDGSIDESLNIALQLQNAISSVVVIDLSRNYGHHNALFVGLEHAKGDLVYMTDIDLEEAPELVYDFYRKWTQLNPAVDVVYGVQEIRDGGWIRKTAGEWFYRVFNMFSTEKIPMNLCMSHLMTRRFVDTVSRYQEREIVISGIFQLAGFDKCEMKIQKTYKGSTSYGWIKNIKTLVRAITSFSSKPLQMIFLLGVAMMLLTGCYIALLVLQKFLFGIPVPGYTSIMVSIWFIGGVVTMSIGVVGIYLSKIFTEIKRRPRGIVREMYAKKQ